MNTDILLSAAGAAWGISVFDVDSGEVIAQHDPELLLSTASVGKLFVLLELAERLVTGSIDPAQPIARSSVEPVADSGLWQHLSAGSLSVADAAVLVAAVSDNLATNALLQHLGLEAVQQWPARLGFAGTTLHDEVRDVRGPHHPPQLSSGTAVELATLLRRMHADHAGSPGAGPQVLRWLATGVDLSMVASAFGVDPLAHGFADRGLHVVNKTGTDDGVRADVGLVRGPARTVAYAVLVNWAPVTPSDPRRDAVLHGMRHIGEQIRAAV